MPYGSLALLTSPNQAIYSDENKGTFFGHPMCLLDTHYRGRRSLQKMKQKGAELTRHLTIQSVESMDIQAWAIVFAPYESDGMFLSLLI